MPTSVVCPCSLPLTLPIMSVLSLEMDMGGLLVLLMKSRFMMTLLNLLSVRLTRKR